MSTLGSAPRCRSPCAKSDTDDPGEYHKGPPRQGRTGLVQGQAALAREADPAVREPNRGARASKGLGRPIFILRVHSSIGRYCALPHRLRPRCSMSLRPVKKIVQAQPTIEGAGVRLRRAFGFGDTSETDPFLLLDDFRNDRPADYRRGFPWHPHRGIETITYVLKGTVSHGDSLGNSGTLGSGDIQWMTAGRGILHQEMPQGDPQGRIHGFQL